MSWAITAGYLVVSALSLAYGVLFTFWMGNAALEPLTTDLTSVSARIVSQVQVLAASLLVLGGQLAFARSVRERRLVSRAVNVVIALSTVAFGAGACFYAFLILWGLGNIDRPLAAVSWLLLPVACCLPSFTLLAGAIATRLTLAEPPRYRTATAITIGTVAAVPVILLLGSYFFTPR